MVRYAQASSALREHFLLTGEATLVTYKCTATCKAEADASALCNDPEIGVDQPVGEPILSEDAKNAPPLGEIVAERLPRYGRC